ncbi:MAG: M3 family metallopeptidase [Cyanobacteria bacterium]|nr:M3 family metallopeptidase [Cyanobacteria bacterium CG_2015-16_32_12]NCO76851.1 M3 family metallopeptidase [Cyanobacteria bacterium CG_2015-22_32_23]NCQ03287.1 M3 family metallopeptidase [Cyanobacteria bacterium CG_2015-09_32_10]NCQ40894.1 M3 family metallopeptidase [Cyanobacteria bacterium CG_2015-04_32_10]NCS84338.1 M3 family metallopeptidase [Cyanobacteria bacterium CG_2015-02_32_10]
MNNISNPLLIGKGLPPFKDIKANHIVPAIKQLLSELETELTTLENNFQPTWQGLVIPLNHIEERLRWSWGIIGHLMGVKNSSELRIAYETVQPQLVEFSNSLSQSKPLYEGFIKIRDSQEWDSFESAQKRIIESAIKEAELSGVALEGDKKEAFNQIQLKLAKLSTKFSNNVLDSTKIFKLRLTTPEDIDGLPASLLSFAAQTARNEGEENATPENGPWMITLDYPSFGPFLKFSKRENLREKVYRGFISRAGSGEFDNNPLITEILTLKQELANILGYENYAQVSLAKKMADSVESVKKLLEELRIVSYPAAQQELKELKEFAKVEELNPWDVSYWAEKQREAKFNFTEEELRPYFSLNQVLEGLFGLANRIFGITITSADGSVPVWHEDVKYFQVADENNEIIAHFYLDAYSRPSEKRGGAWMDDCLGRAKFEENGKIITRLPVAYLTCNQTPPIDDKPSLMTFGEVETLFHEFGHGLQHMLTKIDYSGASGINNVEWDAVELPSQFMENWCLEKNTLFGMAKHYQTGETLPSHYYEKLLASKNYMSGSAMLRQLHFSLIDIELHSSYNPHGDETPHQVRDRVAQTTTVMPPLPEDQFLCAFGHIFGGGYAAGYYSYKWAEVLSADAFSAFEEVGLEDDLAIAKVGRRFRDTVLSLGGSLSPMEIFRQFRGRQPDTKPLLRHSGLLTISK